MNTIITYMIAIAIIGVFYGTPIVLGFIVTRMDFRKKVTHLLTYLQIVWTIGVATVLWALDISSPWGAIIWALLAVLEVVLYVLRLKSSGLVLRARERRDLGHWEEDQ